MKEINIWKKKTKEKLLFSANLIYKVQKSSAEGKSPEPKEELLPGLEPLKPEVPKQPESGVPIDAKEKKEGGSSMYPNIPPRAPDAMSAAEFKEAYKSVEKDPKARQKLIMEQMAKGNVPKNFRFFKPVTIERGGQKITINIATRGVTIGEGEDTFEVPLDGPTSRAVADMYNCTIPNQYLSQKIYEYAKARNKVIPFFGQETFANHNGVKMQRLEWMQLQQSKIQGFVQKHEIDYNNIVGGYFKDVVHPEPGMTANIRNGVEIYGGWSVNGDRIQPLSGRHHGNTYVDYSHRTRLISRMCLVDGKPTPLKDVLKDPIIAKRFGFSPLDIDKSYGSVDSNGNSHYGKWDKSYDIPWAEGFVKDFKKKHPIGSSPAPTQEPVSNKPKKVAEGKLPGLEDKPAVDVPAEPEPPSGGGTSIGGGMPSGGGGPSPGQSGGGAPYGGGGPSYGPSGGGEVTPPITPPITTPEPTPEPPTEEPEKAEPIDQPEKIPEGFKFPKGKKCFVLGDSHGGGWDPQMRRLSSKHGIGMPVEKMWEDGRHTPTMLGKFENLVKRAEHNKALKEQLNGSTLVICAGGNDLLSNFTAEQIFGNLQKIFELAKSVGMKVVTSTIIGVADYYRKDQKEKLKKVMDKTGKVNKMLIAESKRAGSNIDVMLDLHSVFDDPKNPGFLNPKDKGGTVHLQIGSKGSYANAATRIIAGVAQANGHTQS